MCSCVWRWSNLLLEDVHWCLVGLQLLVLQEDLPSQLQRRRQVGVVAEVALKEEARHQTLPKHRLKGRGRLGETSMDGGRRRSQRTKSGERRGRAARIKTATTSQVNKPLMTSAGWEQRAIWTWKASLYQATKKSSPPGQRGRWEAGLKMKAGWYCMMYLRCLDKCRFFFFSPMLKEFFFQKT